MRTFTESPLIGSNTLKILAQLDAKLYVGFGRLQERLNLYPLARGLSFSGDGYLYFAIAFLACLLAPEPGQKLLFSGLFAAAIELPIYWTAKKYFKRQRPYVVHTALARIHIPSDEFSFPSGHATAGFLMAYLVTHFFTGAALPMYLWVSMIALSRVLLRVHFVSDILAGMLLGTGIAMFSLWVFGYS
ncbi:MAG: phosphatase PAP2 family protein [Pseudomonadales bacterium]